MLELPPNVRAKRLRSGAIAYYWEVPTVDRRAGCTLANEALGADPVKAGERARMLNDILYSFRVGEPSGPVPGSVRWLFDWYEQHRKFVRLTERAKQDYRRAMSQVCNVKLETRTCGELPARHLRPRHADLLYEKIRLSRAKPLSRIEKERLAELEQLAGEGLVSAEELGEAPRQRLRSANLAMQVARRVWNLAKRADLVDMNPFAAMGLEGSDGEGVVPATWDELQRFVAKADELGQRSIGTAALAGWEWLQRGTDIFGRLMWADYRAGHEVRVRHHKTGRRKWKPLRDRDGLLFPELEARLATTAQRGSLIIMRDQADEHGVFLPWNLVTVKKLVREIADAAGLPNISFGSFRKGGFTEGGDAELTDQQMMAQGDHATRAMLTVYSRQTSVQAARAARKRRAWREAQETEEDQDSERRSERDSE